MMKNVLWTIVIVLGGAYFVNSYVESEARREAREAEEKRIEKAIKSAVSEMVSRTGAIDGWPDALSKGERYRFASILTVELENVWLDAPILFHGSIKDVATYDKAYYSVLLERGFWASLDNMFATELELLLIAEKQKVDLFLEQNGSIFDELGLNNGVAVVADVEDIETVYRPTQEGREEVKVGKGKLVDIVFTGDTQF